MDFFMNLMGSLPVLHAKKNSTLAAVLGFVAGALGIAIYFRSIIDFIFPLIAIVVFVQVWGDPGWMAGAIFSSGYGFFRAESSNARLAEATGRIAPPAAIVRLASTERSEDV